MALSITAQQEALSTPLSSHSHGLAFPEGPEEQGGMYFTLGALPPVLKSA